MPNFEDVNTISNEEELKNLIGDVDENEEILDDDDSFSEEEEESDENETGDGGDDNDDAEEDDNPEEKIKDKGEPEKKEATEFKSSVHYLNDKYNLGLKVDALPENLSKEQEAEVISNIFDRTLKGVNKVVSEYKDIQKLLDEDEEVKNFIAAKKEGKTLKDFAKQYAQSSEGIDAEQLVREELKIKFPSFTDEDIDDHIELYKSKDKFEKLEATLRDQRKEREAKEIEAQQQREETLKQEREERLNESIKQYEGYIKSQSKVGNVTLTQQMKEQLVRAVKERDEEGRNLLDYALQSDEGVMKATLGILFMEQLMKNSGTSKSNRSKKSLMDKLFDNPEELQSGSTVSPEDDFNAEIANSF